MAIAFAIFALSLIGISGLFVLKMWEMRTARDIAPEIRERADQAALILKQLIARSQEEARKLPPEILILARTILHDAALGAAALARYLEKQSHRVAEKVSHKASFERRETNNHFLKNVSEYRNGNGLDTSDNNGQNA